VVAVSQQGWTKISVNTHSNLHAIVKMGYTDARGLTMQSCVSVGDSGAIFVGDYSGLEWENASVPGITSNLYSVAFPYTDSGIVVGDVMTFLKLTHHSNGVFAIDTSAHAPFMSSRSIRSIWGRDSIPVLFIAGDSGLIARSVNMGRGGSWTNYQGFHTNFNDMRYVKPTACYCAGDSNSIIKGQLGGNYRKQNAPFTLSNISYRHIAFDSDTGWVVGTDGEIAVTNNGGLSWSRLSSGIFTSLNWVGVQSWNGVRYVYAVGDSGVILKTTDDGVTWAHLKSGTQANLNAAFFRDPWHGVVVGDSGTILRTTNGGVDEPVMIVTPGVLSFGNILVGAETKRYFAISNDGVSPLDIPSVTIDNSKFSLSPSSASINPGSHQIFEVSYHPTVAGNESFAISINQSVTGYNEISGAATAVDSSSPHNWVWKNPELTGNALFDVKFLNASSAVAAGDDGTIARTTDDGVTWSVMPFVGGISTPLRAIAIISPDTLFVAGLFGTFLKSQDGGKNWTSAPSFPGGNLQSLAFRNSSLGYVATASRFYWNAYVCSGFFRTTDGGSSWDPLLVTNSLMSVVPWADVQLKIQLLPEHTIVLAGYREGNLMPQIGWGQVPLLMQ
jgi:photosystem II stability/assembly factor-like uncharacterized protein